MISFDDSYCMIRILWNQTKWAVLVNYLTFKSESTLVDILS